MKKLLILGAGTMQVPIIQKAVAMGYHTVVADFNPQAPGIGYADKFYEASTIDKEAIEAVAEKEGIDGILTTSDYPVNVVAHIGDKLGLSAMSTETARICTDKYLQRSLFLEKGIKTPFFKLCNADDDLTAYKDYPYIVKPCNSSASRGVKKVTDPDDLKTAFEDALTYSKTGTALIESFIEGREFSVEALSQNGHTEIIAITEKITKGEDRGYFVEDTHIEPARISKAEKQLIEKEVLAAAEAIGFNNCPSHTEIKLNDKGAWIIETACRLGGDYITSDLVPLSTGVDMLENLIRISMGEEIDTTRKISCVSAVQFLNQDNYDECVRFVKNHPSCIRRYEIEPKHDRVIKSSLDRMGYIIFQFSDFTEMEITLKQIQK